MNSAAKIRCRHGKHERKTEFSIHKNQTIQL
jgi:hypothetical protein